MDFHLFTIIYLEVFTIFCNFTSTIRANQLINKIFLKMGKLYVITISYGLRILEIMFVHMLGQSRQWRSWFELKSPKKTFFKKIANVSENAGFWR